MTHNKQSWKHTVDNVASEFQGNFSSLDWIVSWIVWPQRNSFSKAADPAWFRPTWLELTHGLVGLLPECDSRCQRTEQVACVACRPQQEAVTPRWCLELRRPGVLQSNNSNRPMGGRPRRTQQAWGMKADCWGGLVGPRPETLAELGSGCERMFFCGWLREWGWLAAFKDSNATDTETGGISWSCH